jgi:hypothetical protein
MSETNYFRLIEAYFEGSITSTEKAMLDAKISSDPLVKAEFDLQHNIVKGISNARKQELKSRLALIDLPTNTGALLGSGVKWLAGTVVGVTIFGSILYWSLTTFDTNIKPIDLKITQKLVFNETSLANFPDAVEETEKSKQEKIIKTTSSNIKVLKAASIIEEEKDATARVEPQSLMSYEDDKLFTNQNQDDLENIESREIAHNTINKTEVEFLDPVENVNDFHYRYYNSKLYLYGDFNEMPYQIIELNDKGKKQLFLSHSEEVYMIKDNTTEITQLRKLQDEMLKLEIQLIVEE